MTQRAFKYRFYPMPEQETWLRRTIGCTRLVGQFKDQVQHPLKLAAGI